MELIINSPLLLNGLSNYKFVCMSFYTISCVLCAWLLFVIFTRMTSMGILCYAIINKACGWASHTLKLFCPNQAVWYIQRLWTLLHSYA